MSAADFHQATSFFNFLRKLYEDPDTKFASLFNFEKFDAKEQSGNILPLFLNANNPLSIAVVLSVLGLEKLTGSIPEFIHSTNPFLGEWPHLYIPSKFSGLPVNACFEVILSSAVKDDVLENKEIIDGDELSHVIELCLRVGINKLLSHIEKMYFTPMQLVVNTSPHLYFEPQ